MSVIKGGFYIKARCIQEASISTQPPYVREIWDWLIKEANHSDIGDIKRGMCLRTYKDIQEGLKWFIGWRKMQYNKWQCEKAMLWLTKEAMIATKKTTRGLIISLVNYEKYQDGSNYESYKKATREIQTTETLNNKNEKNEKNERMNTTTAPGKPDAEVGKKPVNWENCKTDLQKVVATYVRVGNAHLYAPGACTQAQATAIFKVQGKPAAEILAQCGDASTACRVVELAAKYYQSKGLDWSLHAVNKSCPDFLNQIAKEKYYVKSDRSE